MKKFQLLFSITILALITLAQEKVAYQSWVTNTVENLVKEEVNKREFTVVEKPTTYFVTTNAAVVPVGENTGASFGESSQGIVYDLYETNSVYFIDDVIPTLKFFAPYRRQAFWPNQITAVEIGDETQVLKTHYLQVDGNLAVNTPENIRFMSTLDRNAAYGEGRALSLQDYLDAFNPVLVPDTIRMFQTNRSDYSVGNVTAHESLTVAKNDGGVAFKVTPDEANFMGVLKVKPTVGPLIYLPGQTDENGVITNYCGYAETNCNVKLMGNLHVTDSTAVSSNLTVWGKLLLSSWDSLRLAFSPYENAINEGKECGYQASLSEYVEELVAPLVAATNKYMLGEQVIAVHTCTSNFNGSSRLTDLGRQVPNGAVNHILFFTENRATYLWEPVPVYCAAFKGKPDNSMNGFFDELLNSSVTLGEARSTNIYIRVSTPGGLTSKGREKETHPRLDVKILFDMSSITFKSYLDLGQYNFVGMGEQFGYDDCEWETLYSNVQPIERTEVVIHTETYTWYDEYWDDELGTWVIDWDNPHTETYEWYDEYIHNMVFEIEPYVCTQFHLRQTGPKAMMVEVSTFYKTNPVR